MSTPTSTTVQPEARQDPTRLLVRPSEAAVVLSISRSAVYRLLREGAIRHRRVGGSIRIPVSALREYAERTE
jgi:excisionase family DNA binding protein